MKNKITSLAIGCITILLLELAAYSDARAQTWVNTGSAGFSAGEVNWTNIAIDGSGTPYVVYED